MSTVQDREDRAARLHEFLERYGLAIESGPFNATPTDYRFQLQLAANKLGEVFEQISEGGSTDGWDEL